MNVHRLLRVLHLESRFCANLHGNAWAIYRSNRFFIASKNTQAILSIDSRTNRIERNKKMRARFNRWLHIQFTAKLQSKSFYMIYNTYSIIFLTQFDEGRWSKSNLSWWQLRCRCDFQLENAKQVRDIAARDAWNVRFSSTMLGSSRISNCHWRTFLLQLRFVSSIDPRTCKQKFHTTHQSRIQQVLVWKLKKNVDERLKKFQYAMWKSERKIGEIGSFFFCYDSEKWLVFPKFC